MSSGLVALLSTVLKVVIGQLFNFLKTEQDLKEAEEKGIKRQSEATLKKALEKHNAIVREAAKRNSRSDVIERLRKRSF